LIEQFIIHLELYAIFIVFFFLTGGKVFIRPDLNIVGIMFPWSEIRGYASFQFFIGCMGVEYLLVLLGFSFIATFLFRREILAYLIPLFNIQVWFFLQITRITLTFLAFFAHPVRDVHPTLNFIGNLLFGVYIISFIVIIFLLKMKCRKARKNEL